MPLTQFVRQAFSDPPPTNKPSMSRICAFLLTLMTAWAVVHCSAGMVTALIGGGVVSLLSRHKGPGVGGDGPHDEL